VESQLSCTRSNNKNKHPNTTLAFLIWLNLVLLVIVGGLIVFYATDGFSFLQAPVARAKANNIIITPQETVIKPVPTSAVTHFVFDNVKLISSELYPVECPGVKAILIDTTREDRVYILNLEGMSVFEIDRASRKINRTLTFEPTPGRGYDYLAKVWINSHQEKPVEGCFTHNNRYLWMSLHNAGGVAVWDLQSDSAAVDTPFKKATITAEGQAPKKVKLKFIRTGHTPKTLKPSPDGKYLFVTNWHDHTTSVIKIDSDNPKDWKRIRNLDTKPVPRGLLVSSDSRYLYVAQMGSNDLNVFDLQTFKQVKKIPIGSHPRHLILKDSLLYISLNGESKIACYNIKTGSILRKATTSQAPRTISFSPDSSLIFVTCYYGNQVQVFTADSLKLLGQVESKLHPVAVEIALENDTLEAWVGNHTDSKVRVFKFLGHKKYSNTDTLVLNKKD
jgi:YVTN family beta-propeller protein